MPRRTGHCRPEEPYLASAEIYQPATNTWTPAPTMTQGRENQTATELPDGQVLVAGGDADGRALGTAELYNPGTTPGNLIPDPGFETPAVPSDYRHSKLARSSAIAHTGSWSLAHTTRSRHGGWDLDSSSAWHAPISPGPTYTASIWVQSTQRVTVTLNIDLLDTAGHQVSSISSPKTTLTASTWTELTITGIKPANGETYAAVAPQFSNATHGTIIYCYDMSLTNP